MSVLTDLKDFFKTEKREKKELRQEIADKYNIPVGEEYSVEQLKETLQILQDERKFIEKHKGTKFTFMGYLMNEDELPKFFYEMKASKLSFNPYTTATTPFTPKTMLLCVRNLEDSEKLRLFGDIKQFEEMYNKIATSAKYQAEDWDKMLRACRGTLDIACAEIEKRYGDKITGEDLERVDWDSFCADIKPYLAPSYKTKPDNMEIQQTLSGQPAVFLTMSSKTSPSFRTVFINGDHVYQSKNGGKYVPSEEMGKVWKDYRREIIMNYVTSVEQEKDDVSTM